MASLKEVERKMEMSLDDIIKLNKSKAQGKSGAKAPTKAASKVTKPGVAGKRQAIQQKKGAKPNSAKAPAGPGKPGMRVKKAVLLSKTAKGGVLKPAATGKKGMGMQQTMAQKILSKARNAKQGAAKVTPGTGGKRPNNIGGKAQGQPQPAKGAPKPVPKAAQQKVGAVAPQFMAQHMNKKQRQRIKGPGAVTQAPTHLVSGGRGGAGPREQPKKWQGGGFGTPKAQLQHVVAGGVGKRKQARAPVLSLDGGPQRHAGFPAAGRGNKKARRLPLPVQQPVYHHQQPAYFSGGGGGGWQQQAPARPPQLHRQPAHGGHANGVGWHGGQTLYVEHLPSFAGPDASRAQGGGRSGHRHGNGGGDVVAVQQRQAALTALRLQQLDDARQRAERAAFIQASMQRMQPKRGQAPGALF